MDFINLTWIVVFLIAIYVLQGFYRGFLVSATNTVGMAISWCVGFLFSPLMSQAIAKGTFYRFILNFTNGDVYKRQTGSRDAWLKIKAIDPSACYNRLCGLEGALRGIRWHNLPDETKKELKDFYNSFK